MHDDLQPCLRACLVALSLTSVACSKGSATPGPDGGGGGGPCETDVDCSGGVCVDVVSSASANPRQCKSACEAYCEEAEWTCTGANALFPDRSACLTACASFPAFGQAGDLSGDTVQCRHAHLLAARSDPSHCVHGGPSGGGACGAWCDVYCRTVQSACTGATAQYPNVVDCLTGCAAFGSDGRPGDLAGDTVQCRLTHAAAAASDASHCAHAGRAGGGVCVRTSAGECEGYCQQVVDVCTGASAQYQGGTAQCETECADIPATGSANDLTGDTVQCRISHANAAEGDSSHCVHAGWYGGNACGGWCDVYCRIVMDACTGANAQYADIAGCVAACGGFGLGGTPGDLTGDTVQCRLSHARAAESDPAVHCAHAGAASPAGACR